jgi:hypothetical protein
MHFSSVRNRFSAVNMRVSLVNMPFSVFKNRAFSAFENSYASFWMDFQEHSKIMEEINTTSWMLDLFDL